MNASGGPIESAQPANSDLLREIETLREVVGSLKQAEEVRTAQFDVANLILRERLARDNMHWDEMAACYHPDSVVNVSWFHGSGHEFVERSSRAVVPGAISLHMMSPPVVVVNGNRAISDTPCVITSFSNVNGVDSVHNLFVRIFWRARRDEGQWLLAGLHCIYLCDLFQGRNPNNQPKFDEEKLATYRSSYRFMMVNLNNAGISVRDDLAGADRPETVLAAREAEQAWLIGR